MEPPNGHFLILLKPLPRGRESIASPGTRTGSSRTDCPNHPEINAASSGRAARCRLTAPHETCPLRRPVCGMTSGAALAAVTLSAAGRSPSAPSSTSPHHVEGARSALWDRRRRVRDAHEMEVEVATEAGSFRGPLHRPASNIHSVASFNVALCPRSPAVFYPRQEHRQRTRHDVDAPGEGPAASRSFPPAQPRLPPRGGSPRALNTGTFRVASRPPQVHAMLAYERLPDPDALDTTPPPLDLHHTRKPPNRASSSASRRCPSSTPAASTTWRSPRRSGRAAQHRPVAPRSTRVGPSCRLGSRSGSTHGFGSLASTPAREHRGARRHPDPGALLDAASLPLEAPRVRPSGEDQRRVPFPLRFSPPSARHLRVKPARQRTIAPREQHSSLLTTTRPARAAHLQRASQVLPHHAYLNGIRYCAPPERFLLFARFLQPARISQSVATVGVRDECGGRDWGARTNTARPG